MPARPPIRRRPKQRLSAHARGVAANIHLDRGQAGGGSGPGDTGGGRANVGVVARRGMTAPRQPSYGAPIVLVVDDGEANRNLMQAFLADIDCRLRTASDGPSALASIHEEAPDL